MLQETIGYFNQQRIFKVNGSLDIQGNDTNARIQLYNPFIILNVSFRKYHNSLIVMQAIRMNAFQTSISFNVSNFLNIYWSFNLNSTEDNNPPSYYSTMLFNVTIFEHFLVYQNSIYWNETLNNKTTVNTNENDKNITIFDYECTINMFKTKEFLTPYYGQPTKFYIHIYVVSPNRSCLRQFSLLTNHGVNIQQSRSIKTSVTSTFADESVYPQSSTKDSNLGPSAVVSLTLPMVVYLRMNIELNCENTTISTNPQTVFSLTQLILS
ncbi:hypothetical protein Smp_157040, partial [Schistosoma mansoni]|uniref:hypothetical protein n=1 Tax=Schistosoma mansoni TaxID=6183 RepID=UPI00022C835E